MVEIYYGCNIFIRSAGVGFIITEYECKNIRHDKMRIWKL